MSQTDYFADFPQPPVDMPCPDTAQTVTTVTLGIVTALVLIGGLVHWHRTRSPLLLLTSIGGALATCNEPIMDICARVWFADHGDQWTVFQAFGRPMPVWVPMVYLAFFGALPYLLARYLERGVDMRRYWMVVAVPIALNAVLEIPLLQKDLYVYYGDQPFELGGLPMFWPFINTLGVMLSCLIVMRFGHLLTGVRALGAAVLPIFTQLAAGGIGLPIFLLGNSEVTGATLCIAACVPFLAGSVAFYVIGRLICVAPARSGLIDRRDVAPAQEESPITTVVG